MKTYKSKLVTALEKLDIHDHICLIYETTPELLSTVIPFIKIGLERDEQCVYIIDDTMLSSVTHALELAGIDVAQAVTQGDLQFLTKSDSYLKNGVFSPDEMIATIKRLADDALKNGYTALRIVGEMTWYLSFTEDDNLLISYESQLNEFFPNHNVIAMCLYNSLRFKAETIKDVIYTHPIIAYGGTVNKNYYYIAPQYFRDKSDETKVQSLLKNILSTQQREEAQKRMERKLQEREDHFRALIENSSDIIILSDGKGHYSYASPSLKYILGYEPEEFLVLDRRDFVHPEDQEMVAEDMRSIQSMQSSYVTGQFRVKHKNGSWRWVESKATNLLKNPSVKAIVSNIRDITERKESEEMLHYQKSLLEVQKEVSPEGILIVSAEGKIISYNAKFASMWRIAADILTEQTDERALEEVIQQVTNPEEFMDRVLYLYSNAEASTDRIFLLDGRIFDRYGSPIQGEDGTYYGYVWFFLDITERERLTRQKDEFIGIASHELKTPVTSIKAYTQILHKRFLKANDQQSAQLVSKMDFQLNKLTVLISDLLDVTKIESGKLVFHKDTFDFNEMVKEIVEEMQRTTDNHVIELRSSGSVMVYGDKDRIGQVVINFLSNAIKYSPEADKVVVETVVDDGAVQLCVQDFGIGLSQADRERIFERFYRVEGAKQETFPGLGLGLYISAEIVKRHNGLIWVEGEKGHGSTFFFKIPLRGILE